MNRKTVRIVSMAVALGFFSHTILHADLGTLGVNALSFAWDQCKKVIPSKVSTTLVACAIGGVVARTLWSRYIRLGRIDQKINPDVALNIDQQEHPIYNWMMGSPGFTTPAQIRSNHTQVKACLKTACLSGLVDVFQYGTGNRLTAGHPIFWADVLSSIDTEIQRITHLMRSIESFVDVSLGGKHLFGVRRNFVVACNDLGITGLDQMRHALSTQQEDMVACQMIEERGIGERIAALCMANPNYDVAHRIFWQLDQRLGRLRAIKEAIFATPIYWHAQLQCALGMSIGL